MGWFLQTCRASFVFATVIVGLIVVLDRALPPPDLHRLPLSSAVLDRKGDLLRLFTIDGGRWRMKADIKQIDPLLLTMLIAYEDQRFMSHFGVDPLASLRALGQFISHGKIISGGSTITMQLVRLLAPRQKRSLSVKFAQILRAIQLEAHYSKQEIMTAYLTLAPYGGNIEGIEAASLIWLGKQPKKLNVAEAALLIALPQSPETRRPDRNRVALKLATDKIIAKMAKNKIINSTEAAQARAMDLPSQRYEMPLFASHLSQFYKHENNVRLTIDRSLQERVEMLARKEAVRLGPDVSIAVLLVNHHTGEVLVRIGSPAPFDQLRKGWNDMSRAIRSPGSALKPFIYGLAFEDGLVVPDSLIGDRPQNFDDWRPRNFSQDLKDNFHGIITIRRALQLSLNLPAVKLLQAVGPLRLAAIFGQAGVKLILPRDANPALAVALGGAGIKLDQLVMLYTGLARGGAPVVLEERFQTLPKQGPKISPAFFGKKASWYVNDILSGTPAPSGFKSLPLSFKTGTSYGYRDAWAVGYDDRYVVGIWSGKADGSSVPDLTGFKAAAPLLFQIFAILGRGHVAMADNIPDGIIKKSDQIPETLRKFDNKPMTANAHFPPPHILFPPQGAQLERTLSPDGTLEPLMIKLEGGKTPYHLLINDRPYGLPLYEKEATLNLEDGYIKLTVVDSIGVAASVGFYVQ